MKHLAVALDTSVPGEKPLFSLSLLIAYKGDLKSLSPSQFMGKSHSKLKHQITMEETEALKEIPFADGSVGNLIPKKINTNDVPDQP